MSIEQKILEFFNSDKSEDYYMPIEIAKNINEPDNIVTNFCWGLAVNNKIQVKKIKNRYRYKALRNTTNKQEA